MSTWGRVGLVVGGYALFGPLGGIAGAALGSAIWPVDYETSMPTIHDMPIQSSAVGIPIPLVLGTARLAGNIIWMGDLQSYQIKHSSGGGKGGGDEQASYETRYRRSFLIAICEGEAKILRTWKDKTLISLNDFTSYAGANNSGISTLIGESYAEYNNVCCAYFEDYELGNSQRIPNFLFEVQVGGSLAVYDSYVDGIDSQKTVYWIGATHVWFAQTFTPDEDYDIISVILKLFRISGSPGTVPVSIRATDIATGKPTGPDLCSGTFNGNNITTDTNGEEVPFTFGSTSSLVVGTKYTIILKSPVTQLTYISWKIDVSSANYSGGSTYISYDAGATWAADPAGGDGDFYFKTQGIGVASDMNFASMIKTLLINERYGGYDESDLITEDFDSIIAYCEANNLKGSIAITQQKPLPDWIAYICSHFQGYFYEIGGKIGLNCYRVQSSVLSITQDDFVRDGDEPPVHTTKRNYSSTFNRLEATWSDRTNDYKTAVVPAFDRIDQRESGQVRTKLLNLRAITNSALASKMAWRIFIDQIYRFSQYAFKLGYKSMLLEVGDVIDVTDGHKLVAKKMRVMSVTEEKDGRRALITAVEDIADFYPAISYAIQESEATPDAPIVLTDGTVAFRENWNSNKLHLSITPGGTQCNGFYIYRSYDDASYDLIGKAAIGGVTGGEVNSTGTIQSQINLPAHTAVIHRKDEFFDVSIGTLTDLDTAITDDNFFNNQKLARIGDEIIGYKTCVESSVEGTWRVSNLIRGLFGTEAVAHVSGEAFNTLDIDFAYTLQESDIGKTLYFKVVSFYAAKIQLTSEVSSQSVVISGKHRTPLPVSLMRINGREGLSTYKTVDVTLDWYFCSKTSGFGRGGYGNALWGAYTKDPLLEWVKVELEEEDGTAILDADYELDDYVEPIQLEILEADRNSKNPVRVKLTPGSNLWSDETRSILIEKT